MLIMKSILLLKNTANGVRLDLSCIVYPMKSSVSKGPPGAYRIGLRLKQVPVFRL